MYKSGKILTQKLGYVAALLSNGKETFKAIYDAENEQHQKIFGGFDATFEEVIDIFDDILKTENETVIISAFPGVGKTYMKEMMPGLDIADSDSSQFSWVKDENGNNTMERNPEFPKNYIDHIKSMIGDKDIILVSSHKEVRDALLDAGLEFTVVVPSPADYMRDEYLERYKVRGSGFAFVKLLEDHWREWTSEIIEDERLSVTVLRKKDFYLTDFFNKNSK